MKVSCYMRKYSQKWDNKLNELLDRGEVKVSSAHYLTFKLPYYSNKTFLFFKYKVKSYKVYEVWTTNKTSNYGEIRKFQGKYLEDEYIYSASKETLERLHKVETKLRVPFLEEAYNKENNMPYTIVNFVREYNKIKETTPSYRIGQYFCSMFLRDSSTPELCSLWNEWDEDKALVSIHDIIQRYDWDYYDLPLLDKNKEK